MDHFTYVDEALKAAADARKVIRKGSSRQVTRGDELDHMKTISSVWFQALREKIKPYSSESDLQEVDGAFRNILDATAKASTRDRYVSSLDNARRSLLQLRKSLPTSEPLATVVASSDEAPDFAPLAAQVEMQEIMNRRWRECITCLHAGAPLAAVVMMGGLIESLFVSKANHLRDKSILANAKRAPTDRKTGKALPFQKWMLNDYIEVGHELEWIGNIARAVSGVLRDYRNYIHPQTEFTKGHKVSQQDARLLWDVTKSLIRELLRGKAE